MLMNIILTSVLRLRFFFSVLNKLKLLKIALKYIICTILNQRSDLQEFILM